MDIFDILLARAGNSGGGGGGGGGGVEPKDVNFIDYDGTILHAYTKQEFAALTAMPDNPSHDGLVADGWNWTLTDAKAQNPVWIGQLYHTASGATEIDVELTSKLLNPYVNLGVDGKVTIDWGDGSTNDTAQGTNLTIRVSTGHTYSAAGTYTIKVSLTSGSGYSILGTNSTPYKAVVSGDPSISSNNAMYGYMAAVKSVRMAANAGLATAALSKCVNLENVALCKNAKAGSYTYESCVKLRSIIFSGDETGSEYSNNRLYGCSYAKAVSTPVTWQAIGSALFQNCNDLVSLFVPPNVATIASNAFTNCFSLRKLRFSPASPPTVANSNAFTGLPTSCIISVPSGSLSAYTGASNYPDDTIYTYVEE